MMINRGYGKQEKSLEVGHFDSRLFNSFNDSIRRRVSKGEGLAMNQGSKPHLLAVLTRSSTFPLYSDIATSFPSFPKNKMKRRAAWPPFLVWCQLTFLAHHIVFQTIRERGQQCYRDLRIEVISPAVQIPADR